MLVVGIIGQGEVSLKAAKPLLADYFEAQGDVLVYFPSYILEPSLKEVCMWVKENYPCERVKKRMLTSYLSNPDSTDAALVVLGTAGSEEDILDAMAQSYPVFDLTRGLISVTAAEVALNGPESHADGVLTVVPEVMRLPPRGTGADLTEILARLNKLEEKVFGTIQVGEQIHTRQESETLNVPEQDDEQPERIKYYKTADGKLRKAGKSKARPNETEEVWLTAEEASK